MYITNSFENEVFLKLSANKNLYDPLIIAEVLPEFQIKSNDSIVMRADAIIRLDYFQQQLNLLVEIKNRTAPKIIEQGIAALQTLIASANNKKYVPALLVPYLSMEVMERLKSKKFSGLDLNGNYYIVTDNIIAIRLDRKNQYKESANIKEIYSRNSSIVGRFLLRKNSAYNKVSEIYDGIQKLDSKITLSTVSKVLSALNEQLIIAKGKNEIRLIQPTRLLANLRNGYRAPTVTKILNVNLPQSRQEAKDILDKYFLNNWIWSGESSADFYAITTPTNQFTTYCKSIEVPQDFIVKYVDVRFYNYTFLIIPPSEEYLLFDSKENTASKIQTYLELSQLGKREKEIARDIEKDILNDFVR